MAKAIAGDNSYQILLFLSDGAKRFNQIIKAGNKGSFANELRVLLKLKHIERKLVDAKPPHSVYKITKVGKDFLKYYAKDRIPKLERELQLIKTIFPDKAQELKKIL